MPTSQSRYAGDGGCLDAVWLLLGKTRYPATFYETFAGRSWVTSVPFDLTIDVIPEILRDPDRQLQHLASEPPGQIEGFQDIVGESAAVREAVGRAKRAALRNVSILLLGESGTGKELFARAIHRASSRRDKPLLAINCAALSKTLLESELVGHKRGAFTGADRDRPGAFESADGGTLFLDEIGECDSETQAKLLRVLQPLPGGGPCRRVIRRLGDDRDRDVDVRIVAATNRDLHVAMRHGAFREDLYYRLATITVTLPPLRERKSDIAKIAERLLDDLNRQFAAEQPGYEHKALSASARAFLKRHDWPGNVRQLHNALIQAAVLADRTTLTRSDLAAALGQMPVGSPGATALLIYPQKALANDQLVKLQAMIQRIRPAQDLADAGLTVLAFCPSRTSAERMIARLPKSELASDSIFRVYRSGLSAEEREEIEQGLRDRSVRVVFSTSALELGIDIGQIDVTLCIGLPPTRMSLWQRAGRSARGGRDGATILLPADTPIDTHYAQHPHEFFERDQEPLVLNLSNRRLVCQHYACAVHEMGGDEDRVLPQIVGPEMARIQELRRQGKLNREEFYRADPHAEVSIRSAGEGAYSLVWENDEIGEIDSFHLLREAYRGAIYRHGGRKFRVRDVIRGRRQVRLRREFSRNETQPFIQKKIRLKHLYATAEYRSVRVAHISLDVTEFLVAVTEKDPSGKTVRSWQGSQGMPPHRLPTEGSMLLLRPPLWSRLAADLGEKKLGALQAAQRLVGSLFPTICAPCDVQDFSSGAERLPTGEYAIFLYDMVYDGVGLTKTAFEHFEVLVENCLQRLDSCACPGDEGGFCCIANPRVDDPVSKRATRIFLQTIYDVLRGQTPAYTRSERDWSDELQTDGTLACRTCGTTLPAEARFCSNCGEKQEVSKSDVPDA